MNDFSTFTYDGTTYNVKDTEARQQIQEIINNLSPQDVVQSDYNQNDTSAADYIKNRPLTINNVTLFEWDGDFENAEEKVDMSILTGISGSYYIKVSNEYYDLAEYNTLTMNINNEEITIQKGQDYTLNSDEVPGITLLQLDDVPIIASIINDMIIPGLEMSFTKGLYIFYLSEVTIIKKGYISNSVQIDFEDNNTDSYTYIKNKPCGKKIVTLLQQDLENIDDNDIVSINEEINYVYVSNEELSSNLKDYEGNTDILIEWNIYQFVRNGKKLNQSQIEDDEDHLIIGYMLSESTDNLPIIINITNHSRSYMGLTFPRNGIYVLYQADEDWEGYNTIVSIKETKYIKIPIRYLDTLENNETLNEDENAHKIITAERLKNFNYLTNSQITNDPQHDSTTLIPSTNTVNQMIARHEGNQSVHVPIFYKLNSIQGDQKVEGIGIYDYDADSPASQDKRLSIVTQGTNKGLWWNGTKIL